MATLRVLTNLSTVALAVIAVCSSSALGAEKDRPYRKGVVPESTSVRASFDTERDSGPDMLLDADEKTRMVPVANTAGGPTSLYFRFSKPVEDLGGIALGPSDGFANYFPEEIQFFVDTTGNGTYDQYVGRVMGLGPKEKTAGDFLFERKPAKAFGLEVRIVKQSRRGVQRAAILSDLWFLYSDATWGSDLKEPAGAVAVTGAKPMDISANIDTPVALLQWSQAKGASAMRAGQNKQAVKVVEQDGKSVLEMSWTTGWKPLAEISPGINPALHLFSQGVVLSVPVNNSECADFRGMGVRVVDANNETFQWGSDLDSSKIGWQDVRIVLDPTRSSGNWGGSDVGRGTIDEPVKISTLIFNAPKSMAAEGGKILVGDIQRNAFDGSQISPSVLLKQLKATTTNARPTMVFTPKDKGPIALRVTHAGELPVDATLAIDATDFYGLTTRWAGPAVALKPGESTDLSVDPTFAKFGWYDLSIVALSQDGKTSAVVGKTMAAYIEPAGLQTLPPSNGFWMGIDARLRSDKDQWVMDACALAGFDLLRAGGWDGHIAPGKFDHKWRHTLMSLAKNAGIRPLNSITFTPKWAVHEKDKGKEPASRYAPREDAVREYIREIIPINKQYGVDIYDLWNEPDLAGFYKGSTDEYLEFMRVAYEEIKKNQPDAMVLSGGIAIMQGHGGHGLNPDLIKRMIVDGQDHYDAISLHLHGTFKGFQEQIDGLLAVLRAQLKKDKPLFFTETGFSSLDRKLVANELMKKIVFSRARGAIGFTTFVFHYQNEIGYSLMNAGPSFEPFPVWAAHNEIAKLMRGNRFVRQVELGTGNWMFAFESGSDALLVAWDEDAPSSDQTALVVLPAGTSAELIDLMGNVTPAPSIDGIVPLALTKQVQYLRIKGADKGNVPLVLGSLASFTEEPIAEPGQKTAAVVMLRNPLAREAEFVLKWIDAAGTASEQRLTIAGRGEAQAKLETVVPSVGAKERARVQLAYEIVGTPWRGKTAVTLNSAQRIPNAEFTTRQADFAMVDETRVHNFNQADPTRAQFTWKGPQDLSSRVWMKLEADHLLMKVEVNDNEHFQPNETANSWRADGLQAAFFIPGRSGFWSIGLARDNGGKSLVHSWMSPSGLKSEYANSVTLETQRTGTTTTYLARLPLEGFGVDAAFLRTRAVGFNLIANDDDNDGGGRKGFSFIAKGMGLGTTTPEEWPRVVFE